MPAAEGAEAVPPSLPEFSSLRVNQRTYWTRDLCGKPPACRPTLDHVQSYTYIVIYEEENKTERRRREKERKRHWYRERENGERRGGSRRKRKGRIEREREKNKTKSQRPTEDSVVFSFYKNWPSLLELLSFSFFFLLFL